MASVDSTSKVSYTGRPIQLNSYAEKVKDDYKWAKETMKFYIDSSQFGNFKASGLDTMQTKQSLYDAYNNIIPQEIFDYASNPLKSTNEKFKGFPAKIRPYNILRPNIDLLIGEWNKRPFYYDVVNADGDDVINTFTMHKEKTFKDNLTQRFINKVNELRQSEGQDESDAPSQDIPDPRTIVSELNLNYSDIRALKGYRALKVMELELKLREIWRRLFKDWLIQGEVYTLKIPMNGEVRYFHLSPLQVAKGKSNLSPYIEDADWATVKFRVSISEMTNLFYSKLSHKDAVELESTPGATYSSKVFNLLNTWNGKKDTTDKVDLFYVCWKAKKTIGFLTYLDPLTYEEQYDLVDEDYKPDKEKGEKIEWYDVEEGWHGWRYAEDKYLAIEPLPAQRNEMANISTCKLPINGRCFSDTESENISVMWLGMPYQILYIILMYRMELTIAKSKGKIFLLDKNVVDDEDDMEETFYYSEAFGYMLVDPKKGSNSFNQYGVHDMSLFKDIKELIGIMEFVKKEWDELIGITRQRKGQNTGSDGKAVNEQSIFRSSVISDLIFTGFEEFLETELAGILDNSKHAWVDGKKGYYRNDEGRLEMLALDPDDYASTQFGTHVQNMSSYLDRFNQLKNQINAIAQRKDVKVSTIIDLTMTESLTELKALVKKAEVVEQQIIAKMEDDKAVREEAQAEAARRWEVFMNTLEQQNINLDWDRKDNNEIIKGEIAVRAAKDPSNTDPDLSGVYKEANERLKVMQQASNDKAKNRLEQGWQQIEREKMRSQEKIAKENNKTKLKNKTVGEK